MKNLLAIIVLFVAVSLGRTAEWASSQVLSNNVRVYGVCPGGAVVTSLGAHAFGVNGAFLYVWRAETNTAAVTSNSIPAGGKILMASTNGIAPEDYVLITGPNEQYQFTQINAVGTGLLHITNSLNSAPAATEFVLPAGSRIQKLTQIGGERLLDQGSILRHGGGPLYKAAQGRPTVFELRGLTTGTNVMIYLGGTR